jgi:hypothetical protein
MRREATDARPVPTLGSYLGHLEPCSLMQVRAGVLLSARLDVRAFEAEFSGGSPGALSTFVY